MKSMASLVRVLVLVIFGASCDAKAVNVPSASDAATLRLPVSGVAWDWTSAPVRIALVEAQSSGSVTVNGAPCSEGVLSSCLRESRKDGGAQLAMLRLDRRLPWGCVYRLERTCRDAG